MSEALSPDAAGRLAAKYQLAPSDVLIDARLVSRWQAPEDELLEELTRRRSWTPERAERYLTDLREAFGQSR